MRRPNFDRLHSQGCFPRSHYLKARFRGLESVSPCYLEKRRLASLKQKLGGVHRARFKNGPLLGVQENGWPNATAARTSFAACT